MSVLNRGHRKPDAAEAENERTIASFDWRHSRIDHAHIAASHDQNRLAVRRKEHVRPLGVPRIVRPLELQESALKVENAERREGGTHVFIETLVVQPNVLPTRSHSQHDTSWVGGHDRRLVGVQRSLKSNGIIDGNLPTLTQ